MKHYTNTPTGNTHELFEDMMNQVHILVAGQTGSGKSVVINGIIATALHKTPYEVNFILIDPKRVELVDYKALPHTIKYASEPEDMVAALNYAMAMVDIRYKAMQAAGLKKYNGSHIYVVIDELADLMTTNKKQVMPIIQRLCQIGRAARVHVIAATQCPLATVIPTPIKVNFDSKVALKTATAQHSRNIIDITGCEKLPRYGKAYYVTPDGTDIVNVPYIDDDEISRLTAFWKAEKQAVEAAKTAPKAAPVEAPKAPTKRRGLFGRLFG